VFPEIADPGNDTDLFVVTIELYGGNPENVT